MAGVTFRRLVVARLSISNIQSFTLTSGLSRRYIPCVAYCTRVDSVLDQNYRNRINTHGMLLGEHTNCKDFFPSHPQLFLINNTRYFSTQSESKRKEYDQEESSPGNTDTKNPADAKSSSDVNSEAIKDDKVVSKGMETPHIIDIDSEEMMKLSLWQRYKLLLKQYAKVMIPVHVFTSSIWYGSFYYTAAHSGIDVVPIIERLLTKVGLGESILHSINTPTASSLLVAYAMYKIATPARYTVTLGGTTFMIRYLRNKGHMDHAPPADQTLREAMKESMSDIKDTYEKTKQNVKK